MELKELVRPNIWNLEPYSCARNEFKGEASIFLDANENPYGEPYNRYPDPLQLELKSEIARHINMRKTQIMLGNGSDEPIDLVYRVFCRPGVDNVVAIEPTYGMYKVCADVNDVEYRPVLLDDHFQLSAQKLLDATDDKTKVIWICSPNNPTGNLMDTKEIQKVLDGFGGIVVVDEAYIDFSASVSWIRRLDKNPRLIVLRTFSKAWCLAAVRCGMCFASEEIIDIFNKVKYPYNINLLTQQKVLEALRAGDLIRGRAGCIVEDRKALERQLQSVRIVKEIYHSDANFLLVRVEDANATYKALIDEGIVTRNRNNVKLCAGCIRITVGSVPENRKLVEAMSKL